jgi:alcohol dehydrogenase class IV
MFGTVSSAADIVSPRRLVAGDGAAASAAALLADLGVAGAAVLVVADRAIADLGTVDRLVQPLRAHGFDVEVFGAVAAEPDLAAVQEVERAVRSRPFAAVVGVGGGSALDTAKLAAALPTSATPLAELVEGRPLERPTLPLVLVPTTAGTGAEASRNAVVSHVGRKWVVSSPYLCPAVALLDATLTLSMPPAVTAASGVDALCHAVESVLSTNANAFTRAYAFAAMRVIPEALPRAYADGGDLDARREMLHASYLAGLALNAVTVLGHTMGYTIAARTTLGHGVTCAMSLPYCVAYNLAARDRIAEIAATVGCEDASLPHWCRAFGDSLGIPSSLAAVGIDAAATDAMADECVDKYPRPNNPVPFDRERLRRLYACFLEGDLDAAVLDLAVAG